MSEPRSILHIDTERTWRGGEQQVVSLIEKSSERGICLHLAAPPHSAILQRIQPSWCTVHPTALRNSIDFPSAWRLARLCAQQSIGLIHAHTSRAHSIGLMVQRFLRGQAKLVVSRRVEFPVRQGWFGRRKYLNVDLYLPISEAIARNLREGGVAAERIRVVSSGIDVHRFSTPNRQRLVDEFHLPPTATVIGNIAFCERRKRQKDLIDAIHLVLEQNRDVHFFIVGDGEELPGLVEQAKRLNLLDHLTLTGFRDRIEDFYYLFHLFLIVSAF